MWPNDRTGLSKRKKPSIYCQQGKFNKLVTHSHLHSHSFTFLLALTFTILAYSSKLALREPVMQSASINTDWSSIKKSNYIFICFCKKNNNKSAFFSSQYKYCRLLCSFYCLKCVGYCAKCVMNNDDALFSLSFVFFILFRFFCTVFLLSISFITCYFVNIRLMWATHSKHSVTLERDTYLQVDC